jgi:hypothetical protein
MSQQRISEPRLSPPDPAPGGSKRVKVYVRFAGVHEIEMDVPADLDLRDSEAVTDYLDEWTKEHRPTYATNDPEEWRFTRFGLGEFWHPSKPSATGWGFQDPGRAGDKARVFIEGVEE